MNNFIVFGDSHSRCFSSVIETHSFSASSAKGLNNINSLSNTNSKIREIVQANKSKDFIFFFGKVDIDFILNHMYNKDRFLNLSEYLKIIADTYISFIEGLNIKNVYICEIPIPHLNDAMLLKVIDNPVHHNNLNKNLDEKYRPIRYTKVIPYLNRIKLTNQFNTRLQENCIKNGFHFLEINKYFKCGDTYKIPATLLKAEKADHHLDHSIHTLYLQSLNLLSTPEH